MTQDSERELPPFYLRLRKAVRAVNVTMTLSSVVSSIVKSVVVVGTACLAMEITGLLPLLDAFLNAHNGLLIKSAVIYSLLFPLFYALGEIFIAVLKGLFNLREEPNFAQN